MEPQTPGGNKTPSQKKRESIPTSPSKKNGSCCFFDHFFLKKNKNRFGHPFSGKEPFLLSFTKQLFHPSVEVEAGAELLAATTTSGDSFFSLRSGFSNNITKACHNFWALSWCCDIFTAGTFPTDDVVTKQSLITFFQILTLISTIRSQLARLGLFLTTIFPLPPFDAAGVRTEVSQ